MDDLRLWLWLNYATEHNTKLFYSILQRFDDLAEAYECVRKGNLAPFEEAGERVVQRLKAASDPTFLERYLGWMRKNDVHITTPMHEDYPHLLSKTEDCPSVLFYRGQLPKEDALCIAIVGARACSEYGRSIAHLFSSQLVEQGATVVTGLASGIDTAAARGALSCVTGDCPVIGVLGCGIDVVYPRENARLYDEVAERGALVTEFIPKTQPLAHHFPVRNRIMSGMSQGVVVVEAGERSGTMLTVEHAHDQGRDVFAVPGRITDVTSIGTNRLIVRGEAKPIASVYDILVEYREDAGDDVLNSRSREVPFSSLGALSQQIYMALKQGEKDADELLDWIDCSPSALNSSLTELLFSEIIKQLPGRIYALDTIHTVVTFDR